MGKTLRIYSVIVFFTLPGIVKASDYQVRLWQFEQLSEHSFRFVLQVRNNRADAEGAGAWAYNSGQYQLVFNQALLNGGELRGVHLAVDCTGSDLPPGQQLADHDFFFSFPHQALGVNAPSTAGGSAVLLLDHGDWRTLSGFVVKVGDGHHGYRNLGDVQAGLAFRVANSKVFEVDYTMDGDVARRGDGQGGAGGSRELMQGAGALQVASPPRQLAGYWFYGEGPWGDAGQWNRALKAEDGGYVQRVAPAGANVVVVGQATVGGGEFVEVVAGTQGTGGELTVHGVPGAVLRVAPRGSLTAGKIYNDRQAPHGVLLGSDATGMGSLIHDNAGVVGEVQHHVAAAPQWPPAADGWQLLSSSVRGQPLAGVLAPGGGASSWQGWDAALGGWCSPREALLEAGKGYLVAFEQQQVLAFGGELLAEDVQVGPLGGGGAGNQAPGWHLLGNPFGSALAWDHEGWALANLCHSAQVWDRQAGSYRVLSPGRGEVIGVGEGFMVQAEGGPGAGHLRLPAGARVHPPPGHAPGAGGRLLLMARHLDEGTRQGSVVAFDARATAGYDSFLDARFLEGFAPRFYSLAGEQPLAVNTLPGWDPGLVVPLGLVGTGSFSIELWEGLPGITPYLVDRLLQAEHLLAAGSPYLFWAAPGADPLRFELRFAPGAVGVGGQRLQGARLWVAGNTLHMALGAGSTVSRLEVYDLGGRLHLSRTLEQGVHQQQLPGLPGGVYLVRLYTGEGVLTRKIVLW